MTDKNKDPKVTLGGVSLHSIWEQATEIALSSTFSVLPPSPTGRRGGFHDEIQFLVGIEDTFDLHDLEKLLFEAESFKNRNDVNGNKRHPAIFKFSDLLVEDFELFRLETFLRKNKEYQEKMGGAVPPILVEVSEDNPLGPENHIAGPTMRKIARLSKKYCVPAYFGTKARLKNILYPFMYGMPLSQLKVDGITEMSVEDAEILSSSNVVVIGAGRPVSFTVSMFEELSGLFPRGIDNIAEGVKMEKPIRDWEQSKLRRGKGHNKFKRKGKK